MSAGHGSGNHGRRRLGAQEEEHENHERWAVSYADMMTVLVGLFIVLYAMSVVDEVKFEKLKESLAAGFGHRAPSMMVGSTGALTGLESTEIAPDLRSQVGEEAGVSEATADLTEAEKRHAAAVAELERFDEITERIRASLAADGLADRVRFRVTERGLVIGMVADDVFFAPDTARLTDTATRVIDAAGPVLSDLTEQISVEGHANVLPSTRYPTNWELSSDRATQVLRRLVEQRYVAAERIASVGFGDARPLTAADQLDENRRVDVVVLSAAPDEVRALLPALASQR